MLEILVDLIYSSLQHPTFMLTYQPLSETATDHFTAGPSIYQAFVETVIYSLSYE